MRKYLKFLNNQDLKIVSICSFKMAYSQNTKNLQKYTKIVELNRNIEFRNSTLVRDIDFFQQRDFL